MTEVFAVIKRFQGHDEDAWSHWIGEDQLSLHSTREKAEFAIKKQLEILQAWADGQNSIHHSVYDSINNNKIWLTEDNNGHGGEEYDWFYIKPIPVE